MRWTYPGLLVLTTALAADGNVAFLATIGSTPAIMRTGTASGGGGGATCDDIGSCRAALWAALPNPAAATDKKGSGVAKKLQGLFAGIGRDLDKALSLTGAKQAKRYRKAKAKVDRIVAQATAADAKGHLGTSLATLAAAAARLRSFLP